MKLLLTIFFALLTCPAYAADWSWDRTDVARETVGLALTVADWGQTNDIRNHGGMVELNPILGRSPSKKAVADYFTAVLVLHPIISALLPKEAELLGFQLKPRMAWQYIYIGVEATAISSNFKSGLRMDF